MTFLDSLQQNKLLILDSAMGTEIKRRGFETTLPLWGTLALLKRPRLITQIHRDNIASGAQLICTNTFRTQESVLALAGHGEQARRLNQRAVTCARQAVSQESKKVWVLGSMAPIADCYEPWDTPNWSVCLREHRRMARYLADGGADALILETFSHPREIRAALMAAHATGLPVILSLVCHPDGRTLAGERIQDLVKTIDQETWAPHAWAVNCLTPREITAVHKKLTTATNKPTGVYGHVGHANDEDGWSDTGLIDAKEYAQIAQQWRRDGASFIGGCCGTNPEFISKLVRVFK